MQISDIYKASAFGLNSGSGGGGGSTPTGTLSITRNGEHDVSQYAKADVSVATYLTDLLKVLDGSVISFGNASLTSLRSCAFRAATDLIECSLPSATAIRSMAFYGCTSLAYVTLTQCRDIGSQVFEGCTSLEYLELPATRGIGTAAFRGCTNFAGLILPADFVCLLGNVNAFSGTKIASGEGNIFVKDALIDDYKVASNWTTYAAQIRPISEL